MAMRLTAVVALALLAGASAVAPRLRQAAHADHARALLNAAHHSGPAPAPAGAGMTVTEVSFDLENVNYYDLTATEDGSPFHDTSGLLVPVPAEEDFDEKAANKTEVEKVEDEVATEGDEVEEEGAHRIEADMSKPEAELVAVDSGVTLVMPAAHCAESSVRLAIKDSVAFVLKAQLPFVGGPSPAPAPAAGLLQAAAAPVAAPSPAPGPGLEVHVTMLPGAPMQLPHGYVALAQGKFTGARKTAVTATVVQTHNNGIDEGPAIDQAAAQTAASGKLGGTVEFAVQNATGIPAHVGKINVNQTTITQWALNRCEPHLAKMVKQLSVAYTRRMVPWALYNECTNFMGELSFSHDGVATVKDRSKCRAASVELARTWKYGPHQDQIGVGAKGDGAGTVSTKNPPAFAALCQDICEYKFGQDAPQCNVVLGDGLAMQPK